MPWIYAALVHVRTWQSKLTCHWQDIMLIAYGIVLMIGGLAANYASHIGVFRGPDFWLRLAAR